LILIATLLKSRNIVQSASTSEFRNDTVERMRTKLLPIAFSYLKNNFNPTNSGGEPGYTGEAVHFF
jgi:hypothetical protein